MKRLFYRSASCLAILVGFVIAGLGATSAIAQLPAQQSSNGLKVEKIYSRPGLTVPLVRGVEWSPDGKLLSYFRRSWTGASSKTDLYGPAWSNR